MRYKNLSDAELIFLLNQDNEAALRVLYDRYFRQLYYFAIRALKSKELTEDVIQDVFIKVWEKRSELKTEYSLRPLLFTITKRLMLNVIKRAKHEQHILAQMLLENNESETPANWEQTESLFRSAIRQLPERCREVFIACNVEGLSYRETAEKLSISPGTVNSQMVKAIRSIRQFISLRSTLLIVVAWLLR